MANRLYIGARYIPLPFNNPDGSYNWLPGVAYEGLTIVIYDHRSYISKKPVPAISTPPSEDPDHWVDAYLFNADVAEALLSIDELQETKADKDGVYESLWAGELISKNRQTDNTPYLLRETGGDLKRIAPLCYPVLVGASVAENQLIRYPTSGTTFGGVTFTVNNNVIELSGTASASWINCFGSHTTKANHVYLIVTTKIADPNNTNIRIGSLNSYINTTIGTSKMFKPSGSVYDDLGLESYGGPGTDLSGIKFSVNIIDLTQKFGSAIADYAYTLEQATAGSGIAWLRSYGLITDEYKPYNTGTIESVEATAKVIKDENNENAVTYPLGSDVLRGIFKLDANNRLYADGDRKTADGTITRRYPMVDLGTLTWNYVGGGGAHARFTAALNVKQGSAIITSGKLTPTNDYNVVYNHTTDNTIIVHPVASQLEAYSSAYTIGTDFATYLSGCMMVYEAATPTTEISTPFTSPQIVYPDGTEEFVTENNVPVGHETEYPYDLIGLVENLINVPDVPSTDGTYKLQAVRTSSGVTYDWVTD